jgi:hypothetical protein
MAHGTTREADKSAEFASLALDTGELASIAAYRRVIVARVTTVMPAMFERLRVCLFVVVGVAVVVGC